ncbi:MAG: hypothetical protein HYZ75_17615 [Elusimicrobia bacterium]|nr:hypothetical protein [Elusimicrobiota bacterium]
MDLLGELPSEARRRGRTAEFERYLAWLDGMGVNTLLWVPEPAKGGEPRPWLESRPLAAILPNLPLYARDVMDRGPAGAVLKRLLALSPFKFPSLAGASLGWTPGLLSRSFAQGIMLLVELEYQGISRLDVREAVLHSSAVDMALAFGAKELFPLFERWAERRGLKPVFLTYNLGLLTSSVDRWGFDPRGLAFPVNEKRYHVRAASDGTWLRWSGRSTAWEVDAGGTVPLEQALESLREQGLGRALVPYGSFEPASTKERLTAFKDRLARDLKP